MKANDWLQDLGAAGGDGDLPPENHHHHDALHRGGAPSSHGQYYNRWTHPSVTVFLVFIIKGKLSSRFACQPSLTLVKTRPVAWPSTPSAWLHLKYLSRKNPILVKSYILQHCFLIKNRVIPYEIIFSRLQYQFKAKFRYLVWRGFLIKSFISSIRLRGFNSLGITS